MNEKSKKEGKYRHCFYLGNSYENAKDIEPQDAWTTPPAEPPAAPPTAPPTAPPAEPPPAPPTIPATIVRKNQKEMTNDEQESFKAAYTALINSGFMTPHVGIHSNMTHRMHGSMSGPIGFQRFLPWHRVYLHRLEEALRQVDPNLALPYWKWTEDQEIPAWLASFTPDGITRLNGTPIDITRSPGANPNASSLPSEQDITLIMQESTFTPFTTRLEGVPFGAHNLVHVWVGGPMANIPIAPADPLFWLHHAECDRRWHEWQQGHPGQNPSLFGSNAVLDPWPERFDDVLNISAMGYSYA